MEGVAFEQLQTAGGVTQAAPPHYYTMMKVVSSANFQVVRSCKPHQSTYYHFNATKAVGWCPLHTTTPGIILFDTAARWNQQPAVAPLKRCANPKTPLISGVQALLVVGTSVGL